MQTQAVPVTDQLVRTYQNGSEPISLGASVSIQDGWAGLVFVNQRMCDIVSSGTYIVDAATLPELGRRLRLKPGELPKKRPNITVILVNCNVVHLRWSARPLISRGHNDGMTYCELSGTISICVQNPKAFYETLKTSIAKIVKQVTSEARKMFSAMPLDQQAHLVIDGLISDSANVVFEASRLAPRELQQAFQSLHQSIVTETATRLIPLNIACLALTVDSMPEAKRAPCARCGSTIAPTHYGIFRRNVSLLYVRYGTKRDGNFCVRCALVQSALYNGVMLVCGWWGYVGFVLTPIYLIQNTYNVIRILFGPKVAALGPQDLASSPEASWPPAPAIWGRETNE